MLVAIGTAVPAASTVAPASAAAAGGPKVVIVVGATHSVTAKYRSYADAAYAEAIKYTPNVVKVYSPNATWSAVKAAAKGASILIYFGHGNGWPSPYTYDPDYTTKDGFGLNSSAGNGDYNNKYYGEPYVSTLELAENALVMLHHLCYASGNSEPGGAAPSVTTAKKRIDNYGAGFLRGRAGAVLADGHRGPVDYLRAIFTTNQTIESLWRKAPNANGNVASFAGTRSVGATAFMDPESPTSGFYRSLIGDRNLTTKDITGGFAVPGRAAPKADGAPIYDEIPTVTDTATTIEPAAVLPSDTRLTILERVAGSDDTAVFRVEGLDDDAITGYMAARDLEPRDSIAPYLASLAGGGGKSYVTGTTDGHHTLSGTLNESADWTVSIKRGDTTVATTKGSGATFKVDLDVAAAGGDGTYAYRITAIGRVVERPDDRDRHLQDRQRRARAICRLAGHGHGEVGLAQRRSCQGIGGVDHDVQRGRVDRAARGGRGRRHGPNVAGDGRHGHDRGGLERADQQRRPRAGWSLRGAVHAPRCRRQRRSRDHAPGPRGHDPWRRRRVQGPVLPAG